MDDYVDAIVRVKVPMRPNDYDSNGDIIPIACKEEKGDVFAITIEEVKKLCTKNYPDNCKECPFYKNDCENYEKGHKWQDIKRVLPKDW